MVKLTEYKNLVAQWDKIKNGDLKPDDFNHKSKKIIWWKCNKGSDHEWQSQIRSRTQNEGCPFCKNKLVCSDNNLKVKFPELAEQWHPTKNGDLKPDHIVFGSSKKVWWKCNKGSDHEWEARPSDRVKWTRCPFCSNKRVSKDNNLLNNYPEIAKQWHPTKNGDLKPQNFMSGSAKRVWWKCNKADDHEWEGTIVGQTRTTALCPFCSGKRLSKTNDLNNFPKIASEFHPTKNNGLSPSDILSGSTKSIWWRCKNGHEWKTTPYSRVVKGNGCRLCSSGTSSHEIRIFTELKKLFGNDYVEWRKRFSARIEVDIFIPPLNIGIEYDGSYWHKERKTFDKKKNKFFNDLQIKIFRYRSYPLELLTNNDIRVSNEELTKKDINKLVRKINKLSKDNKFNKKLSNYLNKDKFINDIEYRKYLSYLPSPPPEFSFEKIHPEHAKYWHPTKNLPLKPSNFLPSSGKTVWWKCDVAADHEWEQPIANKTHSSCPFCKNRNVSSTNSLLLNYPEIAKQWHPTRNGNLKPNNFTEGSGTRIWWKCEISEDHVWKTAIAKRTLRGDGCPFCSNQRVSEYNNIEKTNPDIAKLWHKTKNGKLKPKDVVFGSPKKVWWKCPEADDHEWEAQVRNVLKVKIPCPYCGKRKPSKDYNFSKDYPEIAKQWHPNKNADLRPEDFLYGSSKRVWWKCDKDDHEWQAPIFRRSQGHGCPKCANKRSRKKLV